MHLLRSCKNFLDVYSTVLVYNAQILSHVIYCLSTWGNMVNNQQKLSLNRLLEKCIKIIGSLGQPSKPVLNLTGLINLENYKFWYKFINYLLPEEILKCAHTDQMGRKLSKRHKYPTRLKSVPNIPKTSTSKYSNSIFCSSLRKFAELPVDIKSCNSYRQFVSKCKRVLATCNSIIINH